MSEQSPSTPNRQTLPHGIPSWVKPGASYFLTLCTHPRGLNQLCQPAIATVIFDSVRHRQTGEIWFVHLLVLMPDHLHVLVSMPPDRALLSTIRLWKTYLARHADIRWQRDFFEHRLRNDKSFEEKARYIRANPVRAGHVTREQDWPYVWPTDR